MNFFKRGVLYLKRKRSKTIILAALSAVIAFLLLVSTAIWNSTDKEMQNLRNTMGGYFKIEANTAQGYTDYVNDDLVKYVMKNDEMKAFSGTDILYALVNDIVLEPGRFTSEGDEKAGLARVIGATASEYNEYFTLKSLVLKEGEHLQADDSDKALISENIADINGLSVGDTISIRNYTEQKDEKKDYTLEIAGIYSIQRTQNEKTVSTAECDLVENFIFVNTDCIRDMLRELKGTVTNNYAYGVTFYVNDPKQLDSIVEKFAADLNEYGERYVFSKNNKIYEESASTLERLNGIMLSMMLTFFVIGSVILSLVLILMMRDRIHEIGILVSMGLRKTEIISQHMFENTVIALGAFCIAWILVNASMTAIEKPLNNVVQSQTIYEERQVSGTESDIEPEEIDISVKIGLPEFAEILGLELLIVVISTGVSSVFIIRLKPRDILSLMS